VNKCFAHPFVRRYAPLWFSIVIFTVLITPVFSQETPGAGEAADTETGAYDESFDDYPDFGQAEGITVIGTPETTQRMEVITKEQIERRHPQDLTTLLEDELDMSITRYGAYGNQTEINMRGFDTERIAILIDGVPANSPRSGEFDVSQIDINNVERIEVIYGGSDTKYNVSGALGGVINIITVKKQPLGFNLGGTFSNTGYLPGQYNTRHPKGTVGEPEYTDLFDMQTLSLFAGYGSETFSWKTSAFGNLAGNHYRYQDDYGFARRKISNEIKDIGGQASLVWDVPKDAILLSDTKAYFAYKDFPITPNSSGSAVSKDFQISENLMFTAPAIRDDLSTEGSFTYQYSNTRYGVDIKSFDHYITAINRWGWYPHDTLTLRAGADWRFLYIDSRSATETQPVKSGNQGGVYLTAEFSPVLNKFMLIGSVKGATDTKQAVAIPKLGFSWNITDTFTLKNNYFRSFKFPDFDDLYYRSLDNIFVGNPHLKPEDGLGADLSGEWTPTETFSANSTVYAQWTEDSIHWIKSAGGRWSPENIGTAQFIGFDVRPVVRIPVNRHGIKSLKLGVTYQYQVSWLLSGTLTYDDGYRIPYMPTHIAGGSVDLVWNTGSALLTAHYETTRYADTMNEMPMDPHLTINATVNQDIGKHCTAFASLRNIANSHYESFSGYYMPGISLTLGGKVKIMSIE
jgi:vitamin B12 transporter